MSRQLVEKIDAPAIIICKLEDGLVPICPAEFDVHLLLEVEEETATLSIILAIGHGDVDTPSMPTVVMENCLPLENIPPFAINSECFLQELASKNPPNCVFGLAAAMAVVSYGEIAVELSVDGKDLQVYLLVGCKKVFRTKGTIPLKQMSEVLRIAD